MKHLKAKLILLVLLICLAFASAAFAVKPLIDGAEKSIEVKQAVEEYRETIAEIRKEAEKAEENEEQHEPIAKLLRSMGATGNFRGFDYIVFIIYQKLQHPNQQYWTTKMAYPETAAHFNVTPGSVERSIRTTIGSIWDEYDHSDIDRVAGRHLEDIPTNSEFLDIVAAYLSYGAYPRDDSYFRY